MEVRTMEDVLDRCRRNDIKLDTNIRKMAELQADIFETKMERQHLAEDGEPTIVHDEALLELRLKWKALSNE
jgi:hypothetical protein